MLTIQIYSVHHINTLVPVYNSQTELQLAHAWLYRLHDAMVTKCIISIVAAVSSYAEVGVNSRVC